MRKFFGAVAVAMLGTACGGPPAVHDVADTTADTVSALITEGSGAVETINGMSALKPINGALRTGLGGAFLGEGTVSAQAAMPQTQDEARAQAEKVAKFLRERIFTEANVEERRGDTLVFRITGEDVCTDGTVPATKACIDEFDKYVVRLTARRVSGELQLGVELGEERASPVLWHFTRTSVELDVNLGESKKAYQYLSSKANPGTNPSLPEVFEGVVSFKVAKDGEEAFTLSTSVKQAVRVEVTDASGEHVAFSTEARAPVASVNFVGLDKKELTFDLDLGRTDLTTSYRDGAGQLVAGKSYVFHLGGATLSLFAKEGQHEASVANVSLGGETTTLKLGSETLLTVDLNRNSGRKLDLSIVAQDAETGAFRVSPGFELELGYHFAPLAQDGHEVDESMMNETHTFALAGVNPGVMPIPSNPTTGAEGGLKVLDGTLTLSKDGSAVVTVGSGQCLLSQTPAAGANGFFDRFTVGACP